MSRTRIALVAVSASAVVAAAGMAGSAQPDHGRSRGPRSPRGAASEGDSYVIQGVVRDFRERRVPGGHPDFERMPDGGYGHYMGMVEDELGADGRPVARSSGFRVVAPWLDGAGRPVIGTKDYIAPRGGDTAGVLAGVPGGALTTAANFDQWFRDVPGVNMSAAFPITLVREPGSSTYVFDDRLATSFADLEGFFIVNGKLMGNSQGGNKNYHFTYEFAADFVHEGGAGHTFTFAGDDDVWVFIDGKLVIDLGGVHPRIGQTIELDRLEWLEDGGRYRLSFFYAERHRATANFRVETTLDLAGAALPAVTGLYD